MRRSKKNATDKKNSDKKVTGVLKKLKKKEGIHKVNSTLL